MFKSNVDVIETVTFRECQPLSTPRCSRSQTGTQKEALQKCGFCRFRDHSQITDGGGIILGVGGAQISQLLVGGGGHPKFYNSQRTP